MTIREHHRRRECAPLGALALALRIIEPDTRASLQQIGRRRDGRNPLVDVPRLDLLRADVRPDVVADAENADCSLKIDALDLPHEVQHIAFPAAAEAMETLDAILPDEDRE